MSVLFTLGLKVICHRFLAVILLAATVLSLSIAAASADYRPVRDSDDTGRRDTTQGSSR